MIRHNTPARGTARVRRAGSGVVERRPERFRNGGEKSIPVTALIIQLWRAGSFVVVKPFFVVVDDNQGSPGSFRRDGFGLEGAFAPGEEDGEGLVGREGREDEGRGAAHLISSFGGLGEDELRGVLFGGEEGAEVLLMLC